VNKEARAKVQQGICSPTRMQLRSKKRLAVPRCSKVLYFPLILGYISALFLPYRAQVKIGILNVKANQNIFRLLLQICFYTWFLKLVETQGKLYILVCSKENDF